METEEEKELVHFTKTKMENIFRVLRSYKLKSPLAPVAGIRYDGLYVLSDPQQEYFTND